MKPRICIIRFKNFCLIFRSIAKYICQIIFTHSPLFLKPSPGLIVLKYEDYLALMFILLDSNGSMLKSNFILILRT